MKPLFIPIKPTLIPTISAVLCSDSVWEYKSMTTQTNSFL